jgi:HlyD family secretion protein
MSNLVAVGGVSREDYEAAQTARATAATQLRAAEHAVARADRERQAAEARLQRPANRNVTVDVIAPVEGVVLKRLRESESVVAAGEPLLEIGDPRQLEIVADLLSADAVRVHAGDAVRIERWGGDRPLEGRVRRIEPSGFTKLSALGVEEQRVNVIVAFDDPCAGAELGDGYRVDARIIIWHAEDALAVPLGALFRHDNAWAVFVENNGRAVLRVIELGERNDDRAQVLSGLTAGQHVVLHPPDTLVDGARIRPRR